MRNEWMGCALIALSMVACDERDPGDVDAGSVVDGATDCGCASEEACVRGVCVASCGADGSALEAGIGDELTPVAAICRSSVARTTRGGEVYDVTTETSGTVTTFVLSRFAIDAAGSAPVPTEVVRTTEDSGSADVMIFAGGYVALSPDGSRSSFGYTTSMDFAGAVLVGAAGDVTSIDAPGNFDAAFLDDDTLLVNGLGVLDQDAGEGVYAADVGATPPTATHVLSEMGAYSGTVAVTADYVVAGASDESFATHVWAVPRADVASAIDAGAPIDVTTDATEVLDPAGAPLPSAFRVIGDRLVTLPFGGPITSYRASWDGTALTLSDPIVLATDGTFTDVLAAPDDRLLLVHPSGLLLVE